VRPLARPREDGAPEPVPRLPPYRLLKDLAHEPAEQLHPGIRAWSAGNYPIEAAAELVIRHGHWLHRTDFLERCTQISAEGPHYIAMRWADAAAAIDAAAASSSERSIALIATAIAGHPTPSDTS
jgi:hypothetical protein